MPPWPTCWRRAKLNADSTIQSNLPVNFCLFAAHFAASDASISLLYAAKCRNYVCPHHGSILASTWQRYIGAPQIIETMMELDLKTSGLLVEMIRAKGRSENSCDAALDFAPRPSPVEAVDTVRCDHIESKPESTKDSTVGSAAPGDGELRGHIHG